ncbi:hypothetical protein H4Q26_010348 [Puccinia striiformis f. sp. tritici PST-130]|nr:hypothetical protein H4Q26_010348 [Puccinia striiformis f. sp. tritici PST-130]
MQNITVETRADAEIFIRTAPKLEAAKSHQDGQLSKPPTKTLALRIADPKDDIVRKLASRITDTLVEGELARDLPMIYMSAMLTRSFHGRLNQPRNERGRSICLKAKHSQRAEFLSKTKTISRTS